MKFVKFRILFTITLKTFQFLLLRTRNYLKIFEYNKDSILMMFYAKIYVRARANGGIRGPPDKTLLRKATR